MHNTTVAPWQHHHAFGSDKQHLEKKTRIVVLITCTMMVAEILVGWLTNSMALLADGWHMGTHAFALGLSLIAYFLARKHAANSHFVFGTWKIEILGAYSSAMVLGIVALAMVVTSIGRLLHPLAIHYDQALVVAVIGLIVNLASAGILGGGTHAHGHAHDHPHPHGGSTSEASRHSHDHHGHEDLNLKSAYLHVIADALTSVLAIAALLGAKYFSWNWLDPAMGLAGAALIARWSALLLRDSSGILLDRDTNAPLSKEIREHIESDGNTRICDLHLWKVADAKYACIISLVTSDKFSTGDYRQRLKDVHELAHTTIEINEYCESV
jgi:cation diffusion facilitator family transporter